MGRLIDADALKRNEQKIATQAWKMQVKASVETILNQFIDDIDHAPTVDAVEVVRCKDCKHCQYDSIFGSYWCGGRLGGIEIEADFFCKDGERKEGDRHD